MSVFQPTLGRADVVLHHPDQHVERDAGHLERDVDGDQLASTGHQHEAKRREEHRRVVLAGLDPAPPHVGSRGHQRQRDGDEEQHLKENGDGVDDVGAEERNLGAPTQQEDRHEQRDQRAGDADVGQIGAALLAAPTEVEQDDEAREDQDDQLGREESDVHWVPSRATIGITPDSTTLVSTCG
jgi:hypothetical protein